jgi:hypothetical protein
LHGGRASCAEKVGLVFNFSRQLDHMTLHLLPLLRRRRRGGGGEENNNNNNISVCFCVYGNLLSYIPAFLKCCGK